MGTINMSEVERIVVNYYPRRTLVSPLGDHSISWQHDVEYRSLLGVLEALAKLGHTIGPGVRSPYDISEEWIVGDALHLQLSYLGPFAAIDHDPAGPIGTS